MREQELQARVTRLRQLIADAVSGEQERTETEVDAWRHYQRFADSSQLPAYDVSPRGIALRAINRIAISYGWSTEIQRFLDHRHASSLSALADDEVDLLLERMMGLEDCVHGCYDPPDMPPAR